MRLTARVALLGMTLPFLCGLPAYAYDLPSYPAMASPDLISPGEAQPTMTLNRQLRVQLGDGSGNDVSGTHPLPTSVSVSVTVPSGTAASQVQPVVQAAAYVSGNSIGGLLQFTAPATASILQNVTVTFASGVLPPMHLLLFNANPSTSTITDKTAIAIAAADLAKEMAYVPVGSCVNTGTPSICQTQQVQEPIVLAAGTTLYAALVADASVTLTASDVSTRPNITAGFFQ